MNILYFHLRAGTMDKKTANLAQFSQFSRFASATVKSSEKSPFNLLCTNYYISVVINYAKYLDNA